jgi:hypothetical protein
VLCNCIHNNQQLTKETADNANGLTVFKTMAIDVQHVLEQNTFLSHCLLYKFSFNVSPQSFEFCSTFCSLSFSFALLLAGNSVPFFFLSLVLSIVPLLVVVLNGDFVFN